MLLLIMLLLGASSTEASRPGPIARGNDAEAKVLLYTRAPDLPELRWLDGQARTLSSLAGQVVVIRSFTHGCPFCASTLPALERLHRELRPRGLQVLGVYHPKPARPVSDQEATSHAQRLGISFPVAVDPTWALVQRWWLSGGRHWTSVTWVLDRRGRIRHVHPGGEYHPDGGPDHARCRDDERQLRAVIDRLLREKPAAASRR